jgi:hypothetical protein
MMNLYHDINVLHHRAFIFRRVTGCFVINLVKRPQLKLQIGDSICSTHLYSAQIFKFPPKQNVRNEMTQVFFMLKLKPCKF